jgi:hypothetical protein
MNGSSPNLTLRMMINNRPVKNVGTEKPMNANVVAMWSKTEYCLTADRMPIGMAITRLHRYATPTTARVLGMRSLISSQTGMRLPKENPQSPWASASSHLT